MNAGGGAQDRSRARRRSLRVGLAAWLLALLTVASGFVVLDRGDPGPQVLLANAAAFDDGGILPSTRSGSGERPGQIEDRQKRVDRLVVPPSGGEAAVPAAATGPSVGSMAVATRSPAGDVGRSDPVAAFDARAPPRAA